LINEKLFAEFVDFITINNIDPRDLETNVSINEVKALLKRSPTSAKIIKEAGVSTSEVADSMSGNVLMENLAKDVNAVLQKTGNAELIGNIIYCQFPTRDFNASTFKLDSGFVVLLNKGLFQFLSKFSRLFIVMMESTAADEDGPFPAPGSTDKLSLTTTMLSFLILNRVGLVSDEMVQREIIDNVSEYQSWDHANLLIRSNLLQGIEFFVFLHEISHITKGHLSSTENFNVIEDGIATISKRHNNIEFEADASSFDYMVEHYGAETVHKYFEYADFLVENKYNVSLETITKKFGKDSKKLLEISGGNNPEIYFGCVPVFFFIADLLDHAYKEMGIINSGTHPHPQDRIDNFISHFKNSIMKEGAVTPRTVSGILDTIELVADPIKSLLSKMIKEQSAES
jgi:hypothetical protein